MKACEKILCGFLVACCDSPKMLDDTEEPFDQIALTVKRKIAIALDLAI